MIRVNLFTGLLCTVIYFINPVKCAGQIKINFPSDLEYSDTIISIPAVQLNTDSFYRISRQDMPIIVPSRMEQAYYSFDNPASYFFLDIPVERMLISIDMDSVIVALHFIVAYTDDLLPAALKKFGNEPPGWTTISTLSLPNDPVPYHHHWKIGEHHLSFSDDITPKNISATQNKRIVISLIKSLKDYYTD